MVAYGQEVAVIGVGCRLPGGIHDMETLWDFLCRKGDATSDIPADRWGTKRFYDPEYETPNKTYMRRGAFIDQKIDEMDPLFFGISPREAAIMDPQQRLLLEVVWEAMEDAGILPARLAGTRTGVIIGTFSLDWLVACGSPLNRSLITDHFAATAASATMLAARISHNLGLQGPCMSIDTACSSSLVAVHQACRSLTNGESDVVVAGGVNLMLAPPASITMSKGHFLATDGRCKSFSADADGYGRGEGCSIVLLKRLADAERDGDVIHGIISGTGVNQDGRTLSLTMPSEEAQRDLIRDVAARADIALANIAYMEAHGTGTPVGDPIEARALGTSIGQKRPVDAPLVIGSLKANLGHLEAAAGVTGLIKAMLCLKHERVPPQANLSRLNPAIPFVELGLHVSQGEGTPLEGADLFAGVNSFGYGGTNAVALLRRVRPAEALLADERPDDVRRPDGQLLLPLNAQGDVSLKALAQSYATALETASDAAVEDFCFSAATYRTRLQNQSVVMGETREALIDRLTALAEGRVSPHVVTGRRRNGASEQPVFVFSGMGSQWKGMGQHLLCHAPNAVLEDVRRLDGLFQAVSGWSIIAEIMRPVDESRIDDTVVAQPAIFIVQVALAETFRFHGVAPAAIVGHSVGEVAAAYIAGALNADDAVRVIYHRSQQQARLAGRGGMLAIGLSGVEAETRLLKGHEDKVSVAALNSARSSTLAGDVAALTEIAAACDREGTFNRMLRVEVPYHSLMMEDIREGMMQALDGLEPLSPAYPLYSTVSGARWAEGAGHDAAYWYHNARNSVLFHDAIAALLADGHHVFLEIGAHPVLTGLIRETAQQADVEIAIVPSLSRKDAEETAIARSMARLYMAGVPLDWARLTGGARTTLPNYAWSRSYFWAETELSRRDRLDGTVHPVLGMPLSASRATWTADINRNYMPWLPDHKVDGVGVFPAAGYIEGALALHRQIDRAQATVLEDLEIGQALLLDSLTPPVVEWAFDAGERVLRVFSARGEGDDEEWIQHARLSILASTLWPVDAVSPLALEDGTVHDIAPELFYARLQEHGFAYGPAFQTIRRLKAGRGVAFAELALGEDVASAEYALHPALLDGAFQALIGAGYDDEESRVFVPTGARQILYRGGEHRALLARAELRQRGRSGIEGDIRLYTPEGEPVAEILGFRAQAIQKLGGAASGAGRRLYRPVWAETDPLPVFAEPLFVKAFGRDAAQLEGLKLTAEAQGIMVDLSIIADIQDDALSAQIAQAPDLVVYLCGGEKASPALTVMDDLRRLISAVGTGDEATPRFVVVTQGATGLEADVSTLRDPEQNAVRGFVRGVASERPDLALRLVEIGRDATPEVLRQLCAELSSRDAEDDVLLTAETRAAGRLVPSESRVDPAPTAYEPDETFEGRPVGIRLVSAANGSIDRLGYARFVCEAPKAGQVLFRTLATALNFKDVLKATGLVPRSVTDDTFHGESLGMEASAEVVAVGEGVEGFVAGERYLVSWPGCFATHFTADAQEIFALPLNGMGTPQEAATLPVAFVTAYYGLCRLARLEAGESVLIHAGTGGVGLAAIQLAKMIGARVYATAGSPEKRRYLEELGCEGVWDSRSLAFADGVRAATGGQGVDVVLNSLAGEGQTHSLAVVAPYGRFVEIGKRDIIEKRGLPLAPFNDNLAFFSLDLDRMMLERPALMRSLLADIAGLMRGGEVKPLPYSGFAAREASEAFRLLASARHIGKVVIDYTRLEEVKALPLRRQQPVVREDATYLVTGGLGGFGWETARWLAEKGARSLVLTGRTASEGPERLEAIAALEAEGITIRVALVDAADEDAMTRLVGTLAADADCPPLRGAFHCAGVLDDALLQNLDMERISAVLRPKMDGARVLDRVTQGHRLDYFVLYSSVTTVLGNIGQSAYIAANTAMNAIAMNRWNRGEAALVVDWGAISDVGMLSRNETASRALGAAGIKGMAARDALDMLPAMLALDIPEVACVDIDWKLWAQVFPGGDTLARFSPVRLADVADGAAGARLAELAALPEEDRLPYVVSQVKVLIARTLHLEPAGIDDNARLSELGIDSLAGVELQTALRVEFGVEVSILILARDESIRKMSQFLLNRVKIGQTTKLP